MPLRTKVQVALTLLMAAAVAAHAGYGAPHSWLPFCFLLFASVGSSSLLVKLPRSDGSMSANFPFLLVGILVLSPLQALLLAGLAIASQCRPARTWTSLIQCCFNVANAIVATALAYATYVYCHTYVPSAPALTVAAVVYFAWNTGTFAAIIAPSRGESTFHLWRAEFPWYLPFYLIGATLAAMTTWLAEHFGWVTAAMLIPAVYGLYRAYTGQMARLNERKRYLEETEALHMRIIEGLAMAVEAKDETTHDHLFRVRQLAEAVGNALQLSQVEMKALEIAAFLHDIGKLAVPEQILNKPGRLTPEEFRTMTIHPRVGAEILERIRFPYPVVPIVHSHHEWWNGAGYPEGLEGKAIPLGARILTVVDCFDALVSDRPYRHGMTTDQALDIIRSLSGKQFDPAVVLAFEECLLVLQAEDTVPVTGKVFTPLQTEPEVWRGLAPGAGFEAGSDENAGASGPILASRAQGEVALLMEVATACQEAQLLYETSQAHGSHLRLQDLLQLFGDRLQALLHHDACALFIKVGEELVPSAIVGDSAEQFGRKPMPLGEGVSGWVAQRGKPLLNGNVAVERGCPTSAAGTCLFLSALAFPLLDPEGHVFGVLTLYSRRSDVFRKHHLRLLKAVEPKLSLAVGNTLLQNEARDVHIDPVTGLPNARGLFSELETELYRSRQGDFCLAVTTFDLNAISEVVLRRGSAESRRLLKHIAGELRRLTEDRVACGRVGREEFVVVTRTQDRSSAEDRVQVLQEKLWAACQRADATHTVSPCFGTAFFPADGDSAEALLAMAGRRMRNAGAVPVYLPLLDRAGSQLGAVAARA